MSDFLDPFGDFDHIVALPIEKAMIEFRTSISNALYEDQLRVRNGHESGTYTPELRKKYSDDFQKLLAEKTLMLQRSALLPPE